MFFKKYLVARERLDWAKLALKISRINYEHASKEEESQYQRKLNQAQSDIISAEYNFEYQRGRLPLNRVRAWLNPNWRGYLMPEGFDKNKRSDNED